MRHSCGKGSDLPSCGKGCHPFVSGRRPAGAWQAIYDLQKGEVLPMPLSRPMPSVEPGAAELRIRDRSGIYRASYYSRSVRGILVIHAFVKKTQATPLRELDL